MPDTAGARGGHLSHDLPCLRCGHPAHTYLPCSDVCDCAPGEMPGARLGELPRRRATETAA
jgi:hypothetical protein